MSTVNEVAVARKAAVASLAPAIDAAGSRLRALPASPDGPDPLPAIIADLESILATLKAVPVVGVEAAEIVAPTPLVKPKKGAPAPE